MGKKLYRSKEWLEQMYWGEMLSLPQMAKVAKCSTNTIYKYMRKLGIRVRTISEAYSEERKRQMSQRSKDMWKDEEYQHYMSETMKNKWKSKEYRSKVLQAIEIRSNSKEYRRKLSEQGRKSWKDNKERRQKQSETSKERWKNKKYRQRVAQAISEAWDEERRHRMSEMTQARWRQGIYDSVFQSPTNIETQVCAALDNKNVKHQQQHRPNKCSYIYDEFVPPNILIEIHGDYWHVNPLFYKENELTDWQKEKRKRDTEKAAWACENGYILIVLWECEIKEQGASTLIGERVIPLL